MYSPFSSLRQKVERIFSLPVMLQFVSSVVIVAMTAFQVIAVGNGSKSSIIMDLLLCCVLCQLFVYCWFGNEVYEQVLNNKYLKQAVIVNRFLYAEQNSLHLRLRLQLAQFRWEMQENSFDIHD